MPSGNVKRSGNSILRMVFVGVSVLLQVGWILLTVLKLNAYSTVISLMTGVIAALVVLGLYSRSTNSAMKMPWIVLITAFPVMGVSLYLLVGSNGMAIRSKKRLKQLRESQSHLLVRDTDASKVLETEDRAVYNQFRYLQASAGAPVCRATGTEYYAEARDALEAMKQDLAQAQSFIFMEYFIVEDAESFLPVLDILARKAAEGVEVRLMYDDIGSLGYVNLRFAKRMNALGIRCQPFNPAMPVLNLFMNHRDHRKITVIDGKVGYTGGFNLANEYFGITEPYGKWKDTGLRLEGMAVRNLTASFLELWRFSSRQTEEFERYLTVTHREPEDGFVLPFGDDPLGEERLAENAILNMAGQAKSFLYLITPYLIITDELNRALVLAAKRGVDVRIITPGIPDKKLIYRITQSYYAGLTAQGVRVFTYTPGFCHAKQCVCDGRLAMIGTSNLDYRSLYLHFENDVLLYDCSAVAEMTRDFQAMFPKCREILAHEAQKTVLIRLWQCILRLFAPLL